MSLLEQNLNWLRSVAPGLADAFKEQPYLEGSVKFDGFSVYDSSFVKNESQSNYMSLNFFDDQFDLQASCIASGL